MFRSARSDGRGPALGLAAPAPGPCWRCCSCTPTRSSPADRLIDELWPGQPRGTDSLQVRLSELRKALRSAGEADRLVTRSPGYLLRVRPGELDALRFEQLAAEGNAALADGDAATAARGSMRHCACGAGRRWPTWTACRSPGPRRAGWRRSAWPRWSHGPKRCWPAAGTGTPRRTRDADHGPPLRERFWRQRLLALYRAGRQADALRAYRELRATLVDRARDRARARAARPARAHPAPGSRRWTSRPAPQGSRPAHGPRTRYAQTGDGIHIAYQVLGEGERDIVFVPGLMSHLDLLWEDPETAGFFRRLATLGRLILFDKRDTGLSDRAPADSPLEERIDDVRAVMRAAGSSRAVLFGYSEGAPMSILFAATYPERVTRADPRGGIRPMIPGRPITRAGKGRRRCSTRSTKIAAHRWGQGATIDWFLPSRAGSPEARQLFARFERMAVSPSAFLRIIRMIRQIDVRAVLPAIHVPTLVIQRLDDLITPPCHGRYLAPTSPAPATSSSLATTRCGSPEAGTATSYLPRSRTS